MLASITVWKVRRMGSSQCLQHGSIPRISSVVLLVIVSVWGLQFTAAAHESKWRANSELSRQTTPQDLGNSSDVPAPPTFLETVRPNLLNFTYFGGPVLVEEITVYIIYYGTNFTAHDKEVIRTWISSFTPEQTPTEAPSLAGWWKIVNEYTWGMRGPHVGRKVRYGGEAVDNYSHGKNLNLTALDLKDIIGPFVRPPIGDVGNLTSGLNASGPLPLDSNGIYMVMLAQDVLSVEEVSFCARHNFSCFDADCSFHIVNAIGAYPGPGSSWYEGCNVAQQYPELYNPPPNTPDGGLDSMLKALSHELAEAATDPYDNTAWLLYDKSQENGDMCNFFMGAGGYYYCGFESEAGIVVPINDSCNFYGVPLTSKKDGVRYNLHGVNGSIFAIQYMWSISTKSCQLQALELCSKETVLTGKKGTITNSLFVDGMGMQTYAPGLDCKWIVDVANATQLVFYLKNLATVGGLDYLTISSADGNVTYLSMSGISEHDGNQANIAEINILGSKAVVEFHSDGTRSPYPAATGFELDYLAVSRRT